MSEDFVWNVALLALVASLATSVYLWFFKRQRSGPWIWVSYSIRAAWGVLLGASRSTASGSGRSVYPQ